MQEEMKGRGPSLGGFLAQLLVFVAVIGFLWVFLGTVLPNLAEEKTTELEQKAQERLAQGVPELKVPETILLRNGLEGTCTRDRSVEVRQGRGETVFTYPTVQVAYDCESKGPVWVEFDLHRDGTTRFLYWTERTPERTEVNGK